MRGGATPRRFFAIRDDFIRKGMPRKEAEMRAARIVNADLKPGEKAVGSGHKSAHKKKHA